MHENIIFDWSESTPESIDNIIYPRDALDRARYAQYLTNFLASKGYDQDSNKLNYVLNLNSEWGSGKTYFLRRWAHDLKAYYPVVYVDAWQQDYSDDPLMAIIASMIQQLRDQAGKSVKDIKFRAPRKMISLLKATTPALAGALAKRYLGIDPIKIIESSEEDHIGETIIDEKGNQIDMGTAASKLVNQLIDEHSAKSNAIESLKYNIEQWVEAAKIYTDDGSNIEKRYPAFIFIDELDRCRPSYAIEMLETIKHIFNIPGVVFVVATDTKQLQHVIKSMYGVGFDADMYLGRFFDARYSLKQLPYKQLLSVHCNMKSLSFSTFNDLGITVWPTSLECDETENLATIYAAFKLSAREAIQITERLIASIANLPRGTKLNLYYLAILICFNNKKNKHYAQLPLKIPSFLNNKFQEIDNNMNWEGLKLKLWIDPPYFIDKFKEPSICISYQNRFVAKTYEVEIKEFFCTVHPTYQNTNDAYDSYDTSLTHLKSVISHFEHRNNLNWEDETNQNITHWIAIISYLFNKSGKANFEFYKVLVEFSTALD